MIRHAVRKHFNGIDDEVLTESDGPFAQVVARAATPTDVGAALQCLGEVWSLRPDDARDIVIGNFRTLVSAAEG